jgi:hypothetical protein
MRYDAMGNITSRSDVAAGATWTYDPTHKHQVTQAGSSSLMYAYDANGNVKTRNGTALTWTSYNYPSDVATSTESASFDYGPNRQRWRMTYVSASGTETTYYATPAFEIVATAAGTDYRHYISVNGRPVVVISRTSGGSVNVQSLLTDHQNSISGIVQDQTSAPYAYAKESFSAFGTRPPSVIVFQCFELLSCPWISLPLRKRCRESATTRVNTYLANSSLLNVYQPSAPAQSQQLDEGSTPTPVTDQTASTAGSIDQLNQIVVQAARTGYLAGVPINFNIPFPQGQLWVVYPGNQIYYLGSNYVTKQGNVGANKVR